MSTTESERSAVTCPRCGYDQSGETARWERDEEGACCPVRGICAECGLEFAWRLVLLEGARLPAWFVEAMRVPGSWWSRLKPRWLLTALWAMVPWKFWSRVTMEGGHNVRARAWWVVLVLMMTIVFARLSQVVPLAGLALFRPATPWSPGGLAGCWNELMVLVDIKELWRTVWQDLASNKSGFVSVVAAGALCGPIMLMLLSDTRRIERVSAANVWRAGVYALSPLCVLGLAGTVLLTGEATVESLLRGAGGNVRLYESRWDVYGHFRMGWRGELLYSGWAELLMLWFPVWWLCALSIGFRMRRWVPAWLSVCVPTLLTQVIVYLYSMSS